MTSIRRSRFARNACSATAAMRFTNAMSQSAMLFWPTDALRSCYARDRFKRMIVTGVRQMSFEISRAIRADHPSLAGHFPGAPIVPGVVILDEVASALAEWRKDCQLTGIRAVKFVLALKPEQSFTISLVMAKDAGTDVDFHCRVKDRMIVEGRLQISCGAA